MFFNPPAKCIVDVAVAFSMLQPFDTHFGQTVFGIVMVILGTAGGLFAAPDTRAVPICSLGRLAGRGRIQDRAWRDGKDFGQVYCADG